MAQKEANAVNNVIRAQPGSRLEALAQTYDDVKKRADALNEQLEAYKTSLKTELRALAPNASDIYLSVEGLDQLLRLHAKSTWRVDVKGLKAADPHTYVRWAKQGTSWELQQVNG